VHAAELEVLLPGSRGDVHDARALLERDVVPRDHPVLDASARAEVVERSPVAQPDELLPLDAPDERLVRVARDRDPLPSLPQPVLGIGLHRGRDVRGQRPRRRRPDDERLARVVEQREPHVQGRVAPLLVDAGLGELVLRERGAAARAPLGRTVTEVEPPPLVDDLQELPDVLDVHVAEREVVAAPVHPLAQSDRALGQCARRLRDHLAAALRERGEAVVLDLALRVEPELPLDAHLDPEALTVEAVLVALVVSPERLVALEDVLQRATPGGVDAEHHPVRRHRAVDEAEPRPLRVQLAEPPERVLALPASEDVALERVVLGLVGEGCEHASDSREGFFGV
jgi:hypothetical protein